MTSSVSLSTTRFTLLLVYEWTLLVYTEGYTIPPNARTIHKGVHCLEKRPHVLLENSHPIDNSLESASAFLSNSINSAQEDPYCIHDRELCKCNTTAKTITESQPENYSLPIRIWILEEEQGKQKLQSLNDIHLECINLNEDVFLTRCYEFLETEEQKHFNEDTDNGLNSYCHNISSKRHVYVCTCDNSTTHQKTKVCSVKITHPTSSDFDAVLKNSSFSVNSTTVYILIPQQCQTEIESKDTNFPERPIAIKIANFVLMTISLLSVVMTVFVFSTFPELRNLHGQILMALSVTVLFSHLIFIYDSGNHETEYCLVIGVFLHYCWLSIYSWTSVMTYQLMMIFFRKPITCPIIQRKTFLKYAAIAWLGPIPIILTCLVIDLHLSDHNKLYTFNNFVGMCMLSKLTAIYTFVLPLGVYLSISMVSFLLILYKIIIYRYHKVKPWVAEDSFLSSTYSCVLLFLGCHWIICLIATYTESRYLWFTFSIIGNFHNISIFIAFILVRNSVATAKERKENGRKIEGGSKRMKKLSNLSQNTIMITQGNPTV